MMTRSNRSQDKAILPLLPLFPFHKKEGAIPETTGAPSMISSIFKVIKFTQSRKCKHLHSGKMDVNKIGHFRGFLIRMVVIVNNF